MRTTFISQFLREKEVPATVTVYQSGVPNHSIPYQTITLVTIFPLMVLGETPAVQSTG